MANWEDDSNAPVAVTAGELEQSREGRSSVDLARLDNELRKAVEAIGMMTANLRAFLLSRRPGKLTANTSDPK
jgi:hypothetical protein